MYGHPEAVRRASGWPLNRRARISVKTSLINTKLRDFVNLGVLFLTMWINNCLPHNLQSRT